MCLLIYTLIHQSSTNISGTKTQVYHSQASTAKILGICYNEELNQHRQVLYKTIQESSDNYLTRWG